MNDGRTMRNENDLRWEMNDLSFEHVDGWSWSCGGGGDVFLVEAQRKVDVSFEFQEPRKNTDSLKEPIWWLTICSDVNEVWHLFGKRQKSVNCETDQRASSLACNYSPVQLDQRKRESMVMELCVSQRSQQLGSINKNGNWLNNFTSIVALVHNHGSETVICFKTIQWRIQFEKHSFLIKRNFGLIDESLT